MAGEEDTAGIDRLLSLCDVREGEDPALTMAVHYASRSTDTSSKNYATVAGAGAWNGIPFGVHITTARLVDRPLKYKVINHAEDGAIFYAAYSGICTRKKTMHVPWYCCSKCACAIIAAGISEVVGHVEFLRHTPARWLDDVHLGLTLLQEASVNRVLLTTPTGLTGFIDGKEFPC